MVEKHAIDVDRLNQFTAWAVLRHEPDGPMTEYEGRVFAGIKAEVERHPDAVWMPVTD